jgi:FKBP-type peptidyl-prolyl cis-trans isomerase
MKFKTCLALAALAASSTLNAQEAVKPAAAAPAAPVAKPDMEKVSYFIGRQIGGNFKQQKVEINVDTFAGAIRDVMAGKESKYPQAELEAAMGEFEKYMQSRMAEIQAEMAKEAASKSVEAKAAGTKFLAENAKREGVKTTASGLQYEIVKPGDGAKPVPTDKVNVHYHGTLTSGKVFDSSVQRGEPITFGVQEVIKGWTEGLQLMSVGSKFKFFIPSDLAYGDAGAGADIGPGETLIFEVELLKIEK